MAPHFLTLAAAGSIVDVDATFFIQLGIFIVIGVMLYAVLIRPVVRLIEARRDATEGSMERAGRMSQEAADLSRDVERQILDIRTAASAERLRFIEEARRQEREILERARAESRRGLEATRAEMEKSAAGARAALRLEVDALASTVAARVLGRPL
jgi:F-type H+-transporting ATPase subunit b